MRKSVAKPRTGAAIQSPKVVERRSRIRDALVQSGARMFAERGVDQVSVEELIADVGISRRTFYGFFANKYEIVADILNPILESGTAEFEALSSAPAEDIVPRIIDFYLRTWSDQGNALLVIGAVDRGVLPYIEKGHAAFGSVIKSLLKRAEAAGVLRNGSGDFTFKVLSRTAVPLLRIYADHPDMDSIYRQSMTALLEKDK